MIQDYRMIDYKLLNTYNEMYIPKIDRLLNIVYQYLKKEISYLDAVDIDPDAGLIINYLNFNESMKQSFIDIREGKTFLLISELQEYYSLLVRNAYGHNSLMNLGVALNPEQEKALEVWENERGLHPSFNNDIPF